MEEGTTASWKGTAREKGVELHRAVVHGDLYYCGTNPWHWLACGSTYELLRATHGAAGESLRSRPPSTCCKQWKTTGQTNRPTPCRKAEVCHSYVTVLPTDIECLIAIPHRKQRLQYGCEGFHIRPVTTSGARCPISHVFHSFRR